MGEPAAYAGCEMTDWARSSAGCGLSMSRFVEADGTWGLAAVPKPHDADAS